MIIMWKDEIKKQLTVEQAPTYIMTVLKRMQTLIASTNNKTLNLDVNNDGQITNTDMREIYTILKSFESVEEFLNKIFR